MASSSDTMLIDLPLSTYDGQSSPSIDGNMAEASCTTKTKIGGQGLERYFNDFKEYIRGEQQGKTSAICALCKEMVWHVKNVTSNYSRHLQRKHKPEFDVWTASVKAQSSVDKNGKQPTLLDTLSTPPRLSRYGTIHPRQLELSEMIFRDLIIELDLPLSILEKPAFVRPMSIVDPKFRVPSRRLLTCDYLPKLYDQLIMKLKKICSSTQFVSLTFDAWTDRRMRAFYAVTVHYVDQAGQSKSHLLAFNPLSGKISVVSRLSVYTITMSSHRHIGSHSGENLLAEYERVTTSFGIESKVVRLITDNASNNLSAFGQLLLPGFEPYFAHEDDEDVSDDDTEDADRNAADKGDDNDDESEITSGNEFVRLPCFVHTLQLVVHDGLKDGSSIRSAVAKVAQTAKLTHKSIPAAEKLQDIKMSTPQAVPTRWNSQFLTVSKTLDVPNAVLSELLTEQKRSELLLSTKDTAILREFVSVFTLSAEATTRTQIEKDVSISLVGPSIIGIYFDLENEGKSCKYTGALCKALIISLQQRFGGLLINLELPVDTSLKRRSTFSLFSDELFLIAPFLDGQFRLKWITQSGLSQDIKDRLCHKIKRLVAEAALKLNDSKVQDVTTDDMNCEVTSTTTTVTTNAMSSKIKDTLDSSPMRKRKSLFSYCQTAQTPSKKRRSSVMEEIDEEIMLFLKDPRDDTRLIFDKSEHFPYLYRLALRVFSVPATSAPAERIFSRSGLLMRPHRSRLSKKMLSTLTMIKCNLDLLK
ncbi:unnamed protein product [Adineta ricciae]|uniref:HAT C-terminal dimerisation domain-containing protein n=1 Tax=Adineta ricciae TaxID=249248 RepID=A0A815VQG3_ADIRI|nr:unnamed protein product [Adineta ricciae]